MIWLSPSRDHITKRSAVRGGAGVPVKKGRWNDLPLGRFGVSVAKPPSPALGGSDGADVNCLDSGNCNPRPFSLNESWVQVFKKP